MAHLLVIESWVRAVGLELARALTNAGHTYSFLTRDPRHYTKWASEAGLLTSSVHPLLANAQEVVRVETNDRGALLDRVRELESANRFDGVLTTCDYYLEPAAWICEQLGLPTASSASLRVARHKHWMREACRRAGLPGPQFQAANSEDEAAVFAAHLGYPVVAKAVDLCAGESVCAVHDEPSLRSACRRILAQTRNGRDQERPGVVLVEELLHGEEFSVETCTVHGKTHVIGVTDKHVAGYPAFIETGAMHPAGLTREVAEELGEFVGSALAAVGMTHGLAHVEIKRTPAGLRIVEINPRMGGSYVFDLVRLTTGIDPFDVLFALALGNSPDLVPRRTGFASAALRFVLPPRAGVVLGIEGREEVARQPDVWRVVLDDVVGRHLRAPQDNNDFIGHLIAVDRTGFEAGQRAERALQRLIVRMD